MISICVKDLVGPAEIEKCRSFENDNFAECLRRCERRRRPLIGNGEVEARQFPSTCEPCEQDGSARRRQVAIMVEAQVDDESSVQSWR
jgi:hypothetical protein